VVVSVLAWLAPAWSRGHAEAAEPARVALLWKTPVGAGCASQEEILDQVSRLSERPLVSKEHRFEIEALALLHEGTWVASVALRDEVGRVLGGREVTGPYLACRELDVPVALVVATLLDGLQEPPAPVPVPVAEATAPAAVESARAKPFYAGKLGLGAFVALAWGLAPKVALGAGLQVEVPVGWPLVLEASAYLPGSELDAEGRGARAFTFHAGTGLCPRLVGQRHQLRLCGSAQIGAVVAQGVGLTEPERSAKPLFMLGLEPRLMLGLTTSWALQLSLGAHWVAVHPRFYWEIDGERQGPLGTQAFALLARIGVIDFLR
jgi:hypothetical protein